MYDPRVPNSFAEAVGRRAEKRKRNKMEEEAARRRVEQKLEEQKVVELYQPSKDFTQTSPDEMFRRRLTLSAKLGIKSAQEMAVEESEVEFQKTKHLGLDKVSKVKQALANMGHMEGDALGVSNKGLTSHLMFAPSQMAGGGHKIVMAAPSAKNATTPKKGKPSTVILLRNVRNGDIADEELQQDITQETSKYGHVKVVQLFRRENGELLVFVKFDSVANAFKAADALHERMFNGSPICVSFYPSGSFDGGKLEDMM